MGSIVAVHPGQDGKVVLSQLKLLMEILKRPIVMLVLLMLKYVIKSPVLVGGMSKTLR